MVSRNPAWPRNGVSATGWSRNQGAKGKALRGSTAAQTHRTPVEQSRIRPIEDQMIGVARDFREIALLVHERRAMRLRVAEGRRGCDWGDEKLVLTVLEGRFRGACFCRARSTEDASDRSLNYTRQGAE